MTAIVEVRILPCLDPQKLEPMEKVVVSFDSLYLCLCQNCKNHDGSFLPKPCYFRKLFAWKKCRHHEPIARNPFLAERVLRLTKYGLSLDEAVGYYREWLGDVFEPIECRWK